MRRFRKARSAIIGFALSAFVMIALPCNSADISNLIKYGPPRQLAEIDNKDIDESSGIAVSIRNRDSFWTHNDSGDRPCLYLIDRSGETLADIIQMGRERLPDSGRYRQKYWLPQKHALHR